MKDKTNENAVDVCFWCGKAYDGSDVEITDDTPIFIPTYKPCDCCKKEIGDGIHVIGVTYDPITKDMPPIAADAKEKDLYPTGSMFVAGPSFVDMIFKYAVDHEQLAQEEADDQKKSILEEKLFMLPEDQVVDFIHEFRDRAKENKDEADV